MDETVQMMDIAFNVHLSAHARLLTGPEIQNRFNKFPKCQKSECSTARLSHPTKLMIFDCSNWQIFQSIFQLILNTICTVIKMIYNTDHKCKSPLVRYQPSWFTTTYHVNFKIVFLWMTHNENKLHDFGAATLNPSKHLNWLGSQHS